MTCPFCASENIFFSKKRNMYFCEDCDGCFAQPAQTKGMRIFISYGHDKNAAIVAKIKEYLTEKGYDVWIDTSEIPKGRDWRERITNGLLGSNGVLSFLSKHSVRDPGVCIDELRIAVCLKHAYIRTVLLESEKEVEPPKMVSNTQWIDLSDWASVPEAAWEEYFREKMNDILNAINSEDAVNYNQEMELLAQRLAVSENISREQQLLKQVFVGRKWLTEKVQAWLEDPGSGPMMIYGVPGSGKSAFSANLAQYNPSVLGGIFFEWDNSALSGTDYVIRLLAFKLASRLPDYRKMLCNMLQDKKTAEEKLKFYHGAGLFDLLILDPVQCCIDGNRGKAFVIFDGLDETTDALADLLLRKARQLPGWLKFLFTSRYEETVAGKYDVKAAVYLDDLSSQNTEDIAMLLQSRLQLQDNDPRCAALAKKCEGSFMYANTLCDAVESGNMDLSDPHQLPAGINAFYFEFFSRLFSCHGDFLKVRPFLELLSVEEEVPEELIRKCMSVDKYELWEIRNTLKSLVVGSTASGFDKFKTFKFVHKSIKDWLTAPELSGKFFVDPKNGYIALLNLAKEAKAEGGVQFENPQIGKLCERRYPGWLIKAGCYDAYRDMLLQSFDPEQITRNIVQANRDYTQYYELYSLWRYVDSLPMDYPVKELVEKFKEIVLFPKELMVSAFSHRSFQIAALTLSQCMTTGRFAPVFFAFMSQLYYDGYFRSGASDEFETRDGWDKYYFTRDAVACLKQCDRLGITVPDQVRRTCERMKLSYNYYRGKNEGMFLGGKDGHWKYGILSEEVLFKDVCILDDGLEAELFRNVKEERSRYNTLSLHYYLTHSDEEDPDFVRLCCDNLVDLAAVSRQVIGELTGEADGQAGRAKLKSVARRIEFINSLQTLVG